MNNKAFIAALFIAAILISPTVLVQVKLAKADTPRTITVPDDYTTIQDAINNATAGDTVYVRKGTYYHNGPLGARIDGVTIDKPISLIGEDSETTILKPKYTSMNRLRSGILVTADNVTISGFTIDGTAENSTYKNIFGPFKGYQNRGILVHTTDNVTHDPNGCKIIGNIITDNNIVSIEDYGKGTLISGNTIVEGVSLVYSSDTIISGNNIEINGIGIGVGSCVNVVIKQNNLAGNGADISSFDVQYVGGIFLGNGGNGSIYVYENNITESGFGIQFSGGNCFVYNNNIFRNRIGVLLSNDAGLGTGNRVYNNNLVNNEQNVIVEYSYRNLSSFIVSGNRTDVVSWDNGYVGNYWSDYQSSYPTASEIDSSGIWNTPYIIDANNTDHYPLTGQVDITRPVPTPTPTPTQTPSPSPTSPIIADHSPDYALLLIIGIAIVIVAAALGSTAYLKRRPKHE